MKDPKTPKKLVETLECTLATLEITKPESPQDLRTPGGLPDPQHGAKLGSSNAPPEGPQALHPMLSPCQLPLRLRPWAQQENHG